MQEEIRGDEAGEKEEEDKKREDYQTALQQQQRQQQSIVDKKKNEYLCNLLAVHIQNLSFNNLKMIMKEIKVVSN